MCISHSLALQPTLCTQEHLAGLDIADGSLCSSGERLQRMLQLLADAVGVAGGALGAYERSPEPLSVLVPCTTSCVKTVLGWVQQLVLDSETAEAVCLPSAQLTSGVVAVARLTLLNPRCVRACVRAWRPGIGSHMCMQAQRAKHALLQHGKVK